MVDDTDGRLATLFRDTRRNAYLGWAVVGLTVLVLLESVLDVDVPWIVFSAATLLVMLAPPVGRSDWRVMLPWELLVLAASPVAIRALAPAVEIGTFATYLALATFALLVVAELDMFTPMQVTHGFAVLLVVVTTLASAAIWAIVRWNLDRWLGTGYLIDNELLMIEFVRVTLAGLAAGLIFDLYFRRRDQELTRRFETEVTEP